VRSILKQFPGHKLKEKNVVSLSKTGAAVYLLDEGISFQEV
jgi:hypothetical protein